MDVQNNIEFPFEIEDVESEIIDHRMKHFKGALSRCVRVGPKGFFLPQKYKEDAQDIYNIPLRSSDVFVMGYPRSGTTLTQELVWMVANDLDYERAYAVSMKIRYQFLDKFGVTFATPTISKNIDNNGKNGQIDLLEVDPPGTVEIARAASPRFVKTHLPLSLLPPSLLETAKVVYVARDPRDVAVSYYHLGKFLRSHKFVGDFKTYWYYFVNDLELWTPYFEHVKEAWQRREHPHLLFLFYEEILMDLPAAVRRVASFFNKEYTEEQIARLCEHLGFENFKNNKSVNVDYIKRILFDMPQGDQFIRKGKIGGWRDYFDEEMTQEAERWIKDNLRGSDFNFPHLEKEH